jgi:phosphate transport system protein
MNIEEEVQQLKEAINDMAELTISQMKKAKDAYLANDSELAQEIIHNEKRVNAIELSIDRDCENIFALLNPVASDLRFVISALKINSDLERIGDYADGIADYVVDLTEKLDPSLVKETKIEEMFNIAISMLEDIAIALREDNVKLARKVYQKDSELNKININASKIITEYINNNPKTVRQSLFMFSVIRKIERTGDHIKNIAEDLIFYVEAKVLRHKKMKK